MPTYISSWLERLKYSTLCNGLQELYAVGAVGWDGNGMYGLAIFLRLLQLQQHLWYHSCMHFERCVPVSPPATLMESSTTLTLSPMENGTLIISTSLGLSFLTEQTKDVLCSEPTFCACWSREEFSASAISQAGESCSSLMELMSGQLALIVGRFWCKASLLTHHQSVLSPIQGGEVHRHRRDV